MTILDCHIQLTSQYVKACADKLQTNKSHK